MKKRDGTIFVIVIFFLVISLLIGPVSGFDSDLQITVSSIPVTPVLRGDLLSFTEILPQHSAPIVHLWVSGKKYLEINNLTVKNNSHIEFLRNTTDMPAGRYYLLIQVPGPDDIFDIIYDEKSGMIRNGKKNAGASEIFTLAEARNMYGWDSLKVILREFASSGVDDQVFVYSIDIVEPTISIDPVGDHAIGELIRISGSTNLPVNTTLWISAGPKTFTNYPPNYFDGQVEVFSGPKGNRWSVLLNTSLFRADEYSLMVYPVKNTFASCETAFNMTPRREIIPSTSIVQSTTVPNISVSQQIPEDIVVIDHPKPITRTPLPVEVSMGALGILLILTRGFGRKNG